MPVERLFAIDPDAHATEEIDNLRWGVLMARKGAVPKDRVVNTLGAKASAAGSRAADAGRPRWPPNAVAQSDVVESRAC